MSNLAGITEIWWIDSQDWYSRNNSYNLVRKDSVGKKGGK